MYALQYDPRIEKDLRPIPRLFRERILKRLEKLQGNPRQPGVEKMAGFEGYRLRIHHYRVLFQIDEATKTVRVYRIKHRKEAYR